MHANFAKHPSHHIDRPEGYTFEGQHFSIFFHFHAQAILSLDGQQYKTEPHACVLVGANTPHTIDVDKTILHDWIIFDGKEELAPILKRLGLAENTLYYPENYEAVSHLMERIERHYFAGDECFSVYFDARMRDLFILLAREKNRIPEPDSSRNMPSDSYLHRLRQLLHASPNLSNYEEEKALNTAQCSRSTLFRRYRALFGCTPYEDLQNACIARSERYLLETNFTVNEISALLGYRSANVFINRFKAKHGQTPNVWRKQNRQNEENSKSQPSERTKP